MTIRLNGSTSGYTEIDAPAVAGSNTLVLPTGNGSSGQFLRTNGSGALSWAGGGKILQVVTTNKTDTFSTSSTSFTDLTGLSVSITPSSASNKILICVCIGAVAANAAPVTSGFAIVRGSTAIFVGDAAGSRPQQTFRTASISGDNHAPGGVGFAGLDSPSTTASITYKVQVMSHGSYFTYINRTASDTNTTEAYGGRTASTITVMEVAA